MNKGIQNSNHPPGDRPSSKQTSRIKGNKASSWRRMLLIGALLLFILGLFGASIIAGALMGRNEGIAVAMDVNATQAALSLVDQYTLGVQDLRAGHYDLARQRFEYVLEHDPAFPGATEMLAEAVGVLYATSTPTAIPPTATLTPTPDLRPVEDLLAQARAALAAKDYEAVIETLLTLRNVDPGYQVVAVDGMLFRALRNRGIIKIRDESNLEGGIYDLSLAEKFGPIDRAAQNYRQLARLYMMGSGFWEVYPEQAVYYFGQVAAAAPYLRDASGWTAAARYRAALIQYGDQLYQEDDPCQAEEMYILALSYTYDDGLSSTVTAAGIACRPPTDTPEPTQPVVTYTLTPTFEISPTDTTTPLAGITPSPTTVDGATLTPTPTAPTSPVSSPTFTPTLTPTIGATTTSTGTAEPTASPTITPSITLTPTESDSETAYLTDQGQLDE